MIEVPTGRAGLSARRAALVAVSALLAGLALLVSGARAAAGPPPPPTAAGGQTVTLVGGGLQTPTSFAFGAGAVFAGDGGSEQSTVPNGGVFVIRNGTAVRVPSSLIFVAGMQWHDGALYVSGGSLSSTGPKWQLIRFSGWNGSAFARTRVIYTAPKKFDGFNGLAFGPDGRLYVGVDVGLTNNNDHGPARTPYVYDILSIGANGHGLKVFATGIRQPWQLAFPSGSRTPFVTDLGQDSGAKNPPDFLLRVRRGDNYGFPQCNHTPGSKCRGFTRPFAQFGPHTDLMGLAIIGRRLYLSSFLGTTGKAGEVFSMPLSGGPLKPFLTGFVAPVVGLGAHHGTLYAGEVGTGLVYSVRP